MLSLKIALRYLLSRKSHNAVNVISAISVAGVAVATAAIVVVLSVFNGFSSLAERQFSSIEPDLLATPVHGKVFTDADSLAAAVAALPGVSAAMPALTERGLLTGGDTQLAVVFTGVTADWPAVAALDDIVTDGIFSTELPPGVYDPSGDAAPATAAIGIISRLGSGASSMTLYVPRRRGRINPANPAGAFSARHLIPTAMFRTDRMEIDGDHIFIPLETARSLLRYHRGEASDLHIALQPGADISEVRDAVSSLLGPEFTVADRLEQQADSFRMIAIEKWVTFMMLAFILVIAAFNIISTLSLMVIEKRDNMATLRFMGASRPLVRRVFMLQGILITLAGGVAGILLGVALSLAQQWGGFIRLGGDHSMMTVTTYPVRVLPADILAVAAIVAVIALVTGQITRIFTRKID